MYEEYLIPPIIGFIIGYFTNYLAIIMLFYPRKKILGFQGVFPKRKKDIAKRIAEVSTEVMPDMIRNIEKIPYLGGKIMSVLKKSIENKINSITEEEFEKIILKVVKKELNFISFIGGIIGFLIGLLQVFLL